MENGFEFTVTVLIGDNDRGYSFYVGLWGERWVGYALGGLHGGRSTLYVVPEVADGLKLGKESRDDAIRLTCAVVCDPEHGFGGIDRFFVEESLRGKPDDFRCRECGVVGCAGRCREINGMDLFGFQTHSP